jgi:hypothetical protein
MSKTNKKSIVDQTIGRLNDLSPKLPDKRKGKNVKYTMADVVLAAFAVFFTQSPSFLAHQRALKKKKGISNAQSMFQMDKTPCEQHIRNILDPVPPDNFYDEYNVVFDYLREHGLMDAYRVLGGKHILIALDGTEYFCSCKIGCKNCLHRTLRNSEVENYHTVIAPAMVAPGNPHPIPLPPEFIIPQDGAEKQDCERNASKRWVKSRLSHYIRFSPILLGDDLFANQPFCETVLDNDGHFILVCRRDSHVTLYNWVDAIANAGGVETLSFRVWNGKHGEIWQYRFLNDVPLRLGDDALRVNWCELQITHEDTDKIIYRNAFITDLLITRRNVQEIVKCGRARWKIENETYNNLKTKGYHLEHNFGHGDEYLSMTLFTLNVLAFLLHTVLHLSDEVYKRIREELGRRDTFFNDIRALTRYWLFDSWADLLQFMFIRLDLEPVPD